jgi:hypothetical protein
MEPGFYLVSYDPLVTTKAGREACEAHRLRPFIDGSIRREPDLEHQYPSISCLCRADKFAPRLEVDDLVAYVTNKHRFGLNEPQRRLTAVLRVHQVFPSHQSAAQWYRRRQLGLPANCCVRGNPARPLDESHRRFDSSACAGDAQTFAEWNEEYRRRAEEYPTFVVCEKLWSNLSWSATTVSDSVMKKAFGCIPGTQNPKRRTLDELTALLEQLSIRTRRSRD